MQPATVHAASRADRLSWLTCDVVGDPAVSRLAALAQTTVPLMQQANVVVRETRPDVPGRNCDTHTKISRKILDGPLISSSSEKPFYLAV